MRITPQLYKLFSNFFRELKDGYSPRNGRSSPQNSLSLPLMHFSGAGDSDLPKSATTFGLSDEDIAERNEELRRRNDRYILGESQKNFWRMREYESLKGIKKKTEVLEYSVDLLTDANSRLLRVLKQQDENLEMLDELKEENGRLKKELRKYKRRLKESRDLLDQRRSSFSRFFSPRDDSRYDSP